MERTCSFCGIEQSRVERLYLGPDVAICDVCVDACIQPVDEAHPLPPDPQALATAIGAGLGWGPLNRESAVRAKFCCEYCGKRLLKSLDSYYSWEVDHITPRGEDSLENYAISCHTCNHLKHGYVPAGSTREERIQDAKREIARKRARKLEELQRLRALLGLPSLLAV